MRLQPFPPAARPPTEMQTRSTATPIALSPTNAGLIAGTPRPGFPYPLPTGLPHQSQSPAESTSPHLRCIPNNIFLFFPEAPLTRFGARTQHTAKSTPPHYCLSAHLTFASSSSPSFPGFQSHQCQCYGKHVQETLSLLLGFRKSRNPANLLDGGTSRSIWKSKPPDTARPGSPRSRRRNELPRSLA